MCGSTTHPEKNEEDGVAVHRSRRYRRRGVFLEKNTNNMSKRFTWRRTAHARLAPGERLADGLASGEEAARAPADDDDGEEECEEECGSAAESDEHMLCPG